MSDSARDLPRDPETFLRVFVPERFASIAATLGDVSSEGALVFQVGGRCPLAVRLLGGALDVSEGRPADTLIQIQVAEEDFEPILVPCAGLLADQAETASSEKRLAILKGLTLERERADLVRAVSGSVEFLLVGEAREHRLLLTPGVRAPNLDRVECTVRSTLADFLAVQRGSVNPLELMMNGRVQITGDAQILMALSALFF